jgi:hypothetical protein
MLEEPPSRQKLDALEECLKAQKKKLVEEVRLHAA